MSINNSKKRFFYSLWWLLQAFVLYYYWTIFGVGIFIVAIILTLISCLLFIFQSYKIRAILYLLLSIYSICSLVGVSIIFLFSVRLEQCIWYYTSYFTILVANICLSWRGFWKNWKKCIPLA